MSRLDQIRDRLTGHEALERSPNSDARDMAYLLACVDALREALGPFADEMRFLDDPKSGACGADGSAFLNNFACSLELRHLRAARETIRKLEAP
jgi:hypothetical protein